MIESTLYIKGFPKGFLKAFRKKTDIKPSIIAMFGMILNTYFKWSCNPKYSQEIESYIIEQLQFENGRCLLFEESGHYFITLVAERGKIDAIGRLVKARPITLDGNIFNERIIRPIVNKDKSGIITIEQPNAILIKNNLYDLPTLTLLQPFIDTLNYIWQTLQINLSNNRVKRIIKANDANQANIIKKEINDLIDGIESVKVITDKNALDGIQTLEAVNNSQDIKDIQEVYDWLYNWILTYLGIDNMAQIDKQSGMTTEEIQANQSQTNLFLNSMLEFRQKACDEANRLYPDLNLKVDTITNIQAEKAKQDIINRIAKSQNDN